MPTVMQEIEELTAQLASARKALEEIASNKGTDAITIMQMRNIAICALTPAPQPDLPPYHPTETERDEAEGHYGPRV